MKKNTLIFSLSFFAILLIGLLATDTVVQAIDLGGELVRGAATEAGYAAADETSFAAIIGEVIQVALSFVGVIFLTLTVYAGFLWMNARGDETQISKAQSILRSAVIGMIITVGSYSITAFVVPRIVARTSGPAGGDGVGGRVGCCLMEDNSGDVADVMIVNTEEECEAGGFGGCVPGINFDDCEFEWQPTVEACEAQRPFERL